MAMDIRNYCDSPVYRVEEYETEAELAEFIGECVDVPRIRGYCMQCPRYCKVWSCPEHDFDPLLYWKLFSSLTLYLRKLILPKELTDMTLTREEQAMVVDAVFFRERKSFAGKLRALETDKSIPLHVGHCDLCGVDDCARKDGLPCRHPKLKRFSMESLGADVTKAAEKYFGETLQWNAPGKLPEYFMLVGGLLKAL